MAVEDEDNGIIRYRIKDILAEMNSKLDTISTKLDTKADRQDVIDLKNRLTRLEQTAIRHDDPFAKRFELLETRVGNIDSRIERDHAIEQDRIRRNSTTFTRREKFLALFVAIVTVAVQFAQLAHLGGHL